jgi:hypothetical protein
VTRPVDREHGARWGAGTARFRDDPSLEVGTSVNGRPPRLRSGIDVPHPVGRIKCDDCSTVAVVIMYTRPGRSPLLVAELQVIEDWTPQPPQARTARTEVLPGGTLVADCPAHGAVDVASDDVIDLARRGAIAVTEGAERLPILHVSPSGRRAPLPPSDALPVGEMRAWLGWDTPEP